LVFKYLFCRCVQGLLVAVGSVGAVVSTGSETAEDHVSCPKEDPGEDRVTYFGLVCGTCLSAELSGGADRASESVGCADPGTGFSIGAVCTPVWPPSSEAGLEAGDCMVLPLSAKHRRSSVQMLK
jgi:hypothetical protein